MDERDRLLAELRDAADARGLTFRVGKRKGEASHATVWVGDRFATVPQRGADPKTARIIKRVLGLD